MLYLHLPRQHNGYEQYTIRMNVKVRNANCMAYLREVDTGRELKDSSMTAKGFYIDLANSKYLKVDVSRTNISDLPLNTIHLQTW